MQFKQWLENASYNRNMLNDLVRRLGPGKILGRDIQITPEEMGEITKIFESANDYFKNAIQARPRLSQWYQEYKQWEQTHGVDLIRGSWPNQVVRNGGNIADVQSTDRNVTVPEELYNLLSWREIVRSLAATIKHIGPNGVMGREDPAYGISSKPLMNDLLRIAQILKK